MEPYPQPQVRKRSKWVTGILAFLVPGTGHMYLGLMVKGLVVMMLLAIDIVAIVYTANEGTNVLSTVLLSLFIPIIYFYNLFDALQSADYVNERLNAGTGFPSPEGWNGVEPPAQQSSQQPGYQGHRTLPPAGVVLVVAVLLAVIVATNLNWTQRIFEVTGSLIGAVALLGVGLLLWLWDRRGSNGRNS